jgi:hypothetical protein
MYHVDGYTAELMTQDGNKIVLTAEGDTVDEAIENLRRRLLDVSSLSALRAMANSK